MSTVIADDSFVRLNINISIIFVLSDSKEVGPFTHTVKIIIPRQVMSKIGNECLSLTTSNTLQINPK